MAMIKSSISPTLSRRLRLGRRRRYNRRQLNDGTLCDSTIDGLLLVVKNSVVLFRVSSSSPLPLPLPLPSPLPPPPPTLTLTPRPQPAAAMVMMMW